MAQPLPRKLGLFAAAAVTTAAGLMAVPITGHASPYPLAPGDCKYEFPGGNFILNQSNGFRVEFPASGQNATGKAISYNNRQQVANAGSVTALINGQNFTLTIGWDGGAVGRYDGTVRPDGTVAGQTQDLASPGNTASWNSVTALKCNIEAAPPPVVVQPEVKPEVKPEPLTATVNGDVDLYDTPEGNVIGILRVGEQVTLPSPCPPNQWCEVTGRGFVWGDFLQ